MLWTLLIGLVIGAIAKFLMPGKDPGGIIITMVLGVAGSAVAHWIGMHAGVYYPGEPAGFIASIGGAMLLLFLYRMFLSR